MREEYHSSLEEMRLQSDRFYQFWKACLLPFLYLSCNIATEFLHYKFIIKKIMKYLLLCLLLLLTTHIHAFNVILGNNAASARTYYNLSISLYADSTNTLIIPANTSSSLVFPSQYNNRLTNGVYNCSVDNWGVDPP